MKIQAVCQAMVNRFVLEIAWLDWSRAIEGEITLDRDSVVQDRDSGLRPLNEVRLRESANRFSNLKHPYSSLTIIANREQQNSPS